MDKKLRESLAASYEDRQKQRDFFNGLPKEKPKTVWEEPIPNKEYEPPYLRVWDYVSGRSSGRRSSDYFNRVFADSRAYYMRCGNPYCPLCYPERSQFDNGNVIQGEVVEEWPEIEA